MTVRRHQETASGDFLVKTASGSRPLIVPNDLENDVKGRVRAYQVGDRPLWLESEIVDWILSRPLRPYKGDEVRKNS